jgi:hypothetical protein
MLRRLLVALTLCVPPSAALSPSEIRSAAESAYLYAYPLVLMEFTRNDAPPNTFTHLAEFPSASFRTIVRPNADTLYSNAWLDLSKEPVLLHVPDTGGRFYVVQLLDYWTETFATIGKRTTGTGEAWFAIVGPRWHGTLPSGVRRLDSSTSRVWLFGRIQTNTSADYENVHRLQQGFALTPLSRYPETKAAAPAPGRPVEPPMPPPARVARMSAVEFFRQFLALLPENPPHAADGALVKQLASLGLEAGKPFEPEQLGAEGIAALEAGVKAAAVRLAAGTHDVGNGWQGWGERIGRYGTDYLARAQVARLGLGALPPEEAIYVGRFADSSREPLNGSRRYQMHLPPGGLPPVNAFWSLTLYDAQGYFAANELNRYAIGDRDALERNADGSLDLWIQHDAPGGSQDHNWLPAPAGPFSLVLRMYWPKAEVLDGHWVPPQVTRR